MHLRYIAYDFEMWLASPHSIGGGFFKGQYGLAWTIVRAHAYLIEWGKLPNISAQRVW
jgi:hypothetical protein